MFNLHSKSARDFISHEEIENTIKKIEKLKSNSEYLTEIIAKAKEFKGLNYLEAAVLLESNIPKIDEEIFQLARQIKDKFYGNRVVLFAPLYLSNYCVNECVYCPFHHGNTNMKRKKLSQEEIKTEVISLQDMGHKRLVIETGEDEKNSSIDYVVESIKTIYGIHHKNGAIRRANVNIAATSTENYRKLHDAGIGTYTLFQETYHRENYNKYHPKGPKSDYDFHTEAMDRAMAGGLDDVGIGVLFGLTDYLYDFIAMLMHAEHLETVFGVGPHTISLPRIRPAEDISVEKFEKALLDKIFEKIIAVLRIAVPYTGMILSTRETEAMRERGLEIGITQISGGSNTGIGGYSNSKPVNIGSGDRSVGKISEAGTGTEAGTEAGTVISEAGTGTAVNVGDNSTAQFEVSDERTLDDIVRWLIKLNKIPSFCTACYREGRTGDRFMKLVKSGKIAEICEPNALLSLEEYLQDYASFETKKIGDIHLKEWVKKISSDSVKKKAEDYLKKIVDGERDFRF